MYTLHITKKVSWSSPDGEIISEEEFHNIQKELVDKYIQYKKGNIYVINPDEKYIQKMINIARIFKANVQGDDGEIYADFTEVHSPLKREYRNYRQANLPEDFPIFDDFNSETKVITKMEVLDLTRKESQGLVYIESYIKRYIYKISRISGVIWNGYNLIGGRDYNRQVVLEIAVPTGKLTSTQREKLHELSIFAQENFVHLIINEVD